jgi:hypothetical protein
MKARIAFEAIAVKFGNCDKLERMGIGSGMQSLGKPGKRCLEHGPLISTLSPWAALPLPGNQAAFRVVQELS